MRALTASGKVINGRATQVIEPPKADAATPVEPLDHSGPFAAYVGFERNASVPPDEGNSTEATLTAAISHNIAVVKGLLKKKPPAWERQGLEQR